MFIESGASDDALRQEGHVEFEYLAFTVDTGLLTSIGVYKHLAPYGGKMSKPQTPNFYTSLDTASAKKPPRTDIKNVLLDFSLTQVKMAR